MTMHTLDETAAPSLFNTGLPTRGPWPVERRDATRAVREWLVTNGLGGYAGGPIRGGLTRRHHGLLVAALPPPVGRLACVSTMRARLLLDGRVILLDAEGLLAPPPDALTAEATFGLEGGLPVWTYRFEDITITKRIVMPYRRNTTCVIFSVTPADRPLALECHVTLDIRPHDAVPADVIRQTSHAGARLEIGGRGDVPAVHISAHGGRVEYDLTHHDDAPVELEEERDRGYPHLGRAATAGPVRVTPGPDGIAAITMSTERESPGAAPGVAAWNEEYQRRLELVRRAHVASDPFAAQLVLAADQFVIVPVGHEQTGTGPVPPTPERTIIAGYHWFTDWGRDTMISLEGLTLATGRAGEAREILRLFARHAQDGLIPNLFPEGQRSGLYHTADATLWYFHAIDRYLSVTGDHALLEELLPLLRDIVSHHRVGTRFGISVDPADGLLRQGAHGYQLTWMDAKVGDWVVTPRRGKAVEINALWYNALCLMAAWMADRDAGARRDLETEAARMRASFNRRFWNPRADCLFDVVDGEAGDDASCRPNQLLALSLPHAVLDRERWPAVIEVVRRLLLTPVGLRTLSPEDPDYRAKYFGDLRTRDAAYHQGTVWPWLIGPYVDALLKVSSDRAAVRQVLAGFDAQIDEAGIGSISEIFDAAEPHIARGCVAQAWSVAEVLRVWLKTAR